MRRFLAVAAAFSVLSFAVPTRNALAQQTQAESAPVKPGVEEITVTARKIQEQSQDVPIAITAFSSERLDALVTRDLADLSALAPNLTIGRTDITPAGAIIYLRGVGNSDVEKTQAAGVVVNLDGVDLGSMAGSALDTFDIERIEVLRGPQGTLYGRNTIGGTIAVRRTRPKGEWGSKGQVTLGSFHRNDYRFTLHTPKVGEQLSFMFGFARLNDNGPYKLRETPEGAPLPSPPFPPTASSLGTSGGRGPEKDRRTFLVKALWEPTDGMDWQLTFERLRDRGDSNLQQHLSGLPGVSSPSGEFACTIYGICNFPRNTDTISNDWNLGQRQDIDSTTLEGNWDLGPFTLTSITGWIDSTEDLSFDVDGSSAFVFHVQRPAWYQQFSQELRATGTLWDDRISYVLGGYYAWNEYEVNAVNQIPLIGLFGADTATQRGNQKNTAPAAFANVITALSPSVNLILGGRYTWEWKEFQGCSGTVSTGLTLCNADFATGQLVQDDVDDTWRKFTPKIGMDWQPNDDLLFWASWSTGFRSGGYNGRNFAITNIGPYEPETLSSWDLGVKSDWLDKRLRVNLGLFYNEYRNKQETVITLDPVLGTVTTIANAGLARLQGYELEVSAVPVDGLNLGASYAYIDAKYLDFFADLDGDGIATDNSDRPVSAAPRYQIAAWMSYTLPFEIGPGFLTLAGQYRFSDKVKSPVTEDPRADVVSFPILDVSARYDFELTRGRYHATFFYRNLLDEVNTLGGVINPPLFDFVGQYPGRTWGVELGYEF